MAMSDYSLSDIAAVTDGVGGGNRNGSGWGDGGWWILLLFILLGFNGNRGWGNGSAGQAGGNELYPWLNQADTVNGGFRDQMIQTTIQGVQQQTQSLSTQLCNCCADIQMALANGFSGVEQGANARQMANMQQLFGLQTAVSQGFNGLSAQFADCCCENRLGLANLGADLAREACADRQAVSDGIRDVLANQNAGIQRILDQLCADKLDEKNDEIAQLRQQLNMQALAASQTAQNAFIQQGLNNEVDALYQRLRDCPVGTMPVYGSQPIFTCPQNQTCGCGCGNGF